MADAVVTFLLENLSQLIQQEAIWLVGVEDKVKSLRDKLKLIHAFLIDSEGKRNDHEAVKELIRQIRDVAYDAEDLIDIHVYNVAKQKRRNPVNRFLHKLDYRDVVKKIDDITKVVDEIYANKAKFGIEIMPRGDLPFAGLAARRRRAPNVEEVDVVGFKNEVNIVKGRLMRGPWRRDIVSITGMGGLGKTTLARKVYNDSSVCGHFEKRAWIYVSQDHQTKDLLQGILACVNPQLMQQEMTNMSETQLLNTLYESLKGLRYLIVLDDVWQKEVWVDLKGGFPDEKIASRILLTSRLNEVALFANPSRPPHQLRFLDKEESWELFVKKVFHGESCPIALKKLGEEMVERCSGLPLAIVVLSGLLSKKDKISSVWSKVASNVSMYLAQDPKQFMNILAISYNNLPHCLKACFLYFSAFPEDFEIPVRLLLRLWVAEGFIQSRDDRKSLEDLAEEYLEELIDWNLVQVAERRSDGGGAKSCRIHDFLRDLCVSQSKEERFFQLQTSKNSISPPVNPRRLSVLSSFIEYISSNPSTSHVRSLLCFPSDEGKFQAKHWKLIYDHFDLLRVLDLGNINGRCLPSEIEKLVHLRYLRVHSPSMSALLPDSIGNLWNLQTLDIRNESTYRLPKAIWKLKQLKHLYCYRNTLPDTNSDGDVLINLQTISTISLENCSAIILSRFPNLIRLVVTVIVSSISSFKNMAKLEHLLRLKLEKDKFFENLFPHTQVLPRLPHWNEFPSNITKLTIKMEILSDPMPILEKLPNLEVLKLVRAYLGHILTCSAEGFPRLRVLHFDSLSITEFEIGRGSMLLLERLVVKNCKELWEVHSSLEDVNLFREMKHLSSFRELVLHGCCYNASTLARESEKLYKDRLKVLITKA